MPLLYSQHTKPVLDKLSLTAKNVTQNVCYKSQLFLPINKKIDVSPLNNDAISGYYFNIGELKVFRNFQFYIPKKLNWLIIPHNKVDWLSYNVAEENILDFIKEIIERIGSFNPIYKNVYTTNEERYLAVLPKHNKLPKNLRFGFQDIINHHVMK